MGALGVGVSTTGACVGVGSGDSEGVAVGTGGRVDVALGAAGPTVLVGVGIIEATGNEGAVRVGT